MRAAVELLLNQASAEQIAEHLSRCDADFVPPLSTRVKIKDYALKIASKATRFEAWSGGALVGLVATYDNDQEKRIAYITNVSVLNEWTGQGIAQSLMNQCVAHVNILGMRQISMEVAADNTPAINLYEKSGFIVRKKNGPFADMNLYLKSGGRA